MVFVNSKKYACQSCIKGHRSSSCHHNDRPLFEIKKKGRPVSQCEKCREARNTRRIHAKCTCGGGDSRAEMSQSEVAPAASKKGKRFVPTVPTLPNGLQDAFKRPEPASSDATHPRRRFDSILNPCHCKSVWDCKCQHQTGASTSTTVPKGSSIFSEGLSALAHVAACCAPISPTESRPWLSATETNTSVRKSRVDCPHGHTTVSAGSKRPGISKTSKKLLPSTATTGPTLRPIRLSAPAPTADTTTHEHPLFPAALPIAPREATHVHEHCGCGQRCSCPGCTLHQSNSGPSSSSASTPGIGCTHECTTCIDHEGGVELPGHKASSTFMDQFFARAASLPTPPPTRTVNLDPTNVVIYPPTLFSGSATTGGERGLAFGLVNVPKLECCGGRCSCPETMCGCGSECNGCCADDAGTAPPGAAHSTTPSSKPRQGSPLASLSKPATAPSNGRVGSCCS